MKTLPQWQQAAHALFVKLGEYDCTQCDGHAILNCNGCGGSGRRELTPTFIASRLALIHLEISRAVECVLKGELKFDWSADLRMPFLIDPDDSSAQIMAKGWKPDGFPVSIATVFLRLCDLAEALESRVVDTEECTVGDEGSADAYANELPAILAELSALHHEVSHLGENEEVDIATLVTLAATCKVDFHAMASLKLDWWMRQGKEMGT